MSTHHQSQSIRYIKRWGVVVIDGYRFVIGSQMQEVSYLKCANFRNKCRARAILHKSTGKVQLRQGKHNHSRQQTTTTSHRRWHSMCVQLAALI
ncbi:uncharacterized protein pre-mod(mdg4)-AE [Drosophila tropicalis]|uniref:uncharacterized protein pre-mod(mdg4)-AE n=1 Tax=Drosophila tropicalis TaxID=46794 RepID=UPI0035AB76C2